MTTYTRENVIENVRFLLDHDRAAKHLTVGIDCTIERSKSKNIKAFLEAYKKEIKEGRMNVVIYNSGQKFDMLGMDNYYACPFYMVNNGGEQWKPFEALFTDPVHQTDTLSHQWFNLAYKYASDSLQSYKELIFSNTRYILDNIPDFLKPEAAPNQSLKVNSGADDVDLCFIDIKTLGSERNDKRWTLFNMFYEQMAAAKIKVFSRLSFGFNHPCILVFDRPDFADVGTIRLTPGINPCENESIIQYFQSLKKLSI